MGTLNQLCVFATLRETTHQSDFPLNRIWPNLIELQSRPWIALRIFVYRSFVAPRLLNGPPWSFDLDHKIFYLDHNNELAQDQS